MLAGGSDGGLVLFGAPLDTGNLGVSALGLATLEAVHHRRPRAHLTIFDNGRGSRPLRSGSAADGHVTLRGAWLSRRVYRGESLYTTSAAARVAPWTNTNAREIAGASLALDASGGDSFSDIYGRKRYRQVVLPKRVVLGLGRPLVLLPQTYGPYHDARGRATAAHIVTGAAQAWARDGTSFERLVDLVGRDFDAGRHREGVDVAFALRPRPPASSNDHGFWSWLRSEGPVVGVNVSGLLLGRDASERFGLRADHRDVVHGLVRRLLDDGVRVVLVPHVRGDSAESDDAASEQVRERLRRPAGLRIVPRGLGAPETKWVIGQLGWFAGARMHATIAALSSCVPVAGIAYSDKMAGVFGTCGVEDEVHDARRASTHELLDALWASWDHREVTRRRLGEHVPTVLARAEAQFDDILASERHAEVPV